MRHLQFWINAFIPRQIRDVTVKLPGGGKTVLPVFKTVTALVPDCIDYYFATDDRDWSNHPLSSSRIHAMLELDLNGPHARILRNDVWCDYTEEYDSKGARVGGRRALPRGERFQLMTSERVVRLKYRVEANNPLMRGSPDIEFFGELVVDRDRRELFLSGFVDRFPAFESYVRVDHGSPQPVFRIGIEPGRTPWSLLHYRGHVPVSPVPVVRLS